VPFLFEAEGAVLREANPVPKDSDFMPSWAQMDPVRQRGVLKIRLQRIYSALRLDRMVRAYVLGVTKAEIAKREHLCRARVDQILRRFVDECAYRFGDCEP
jgi:hypothetical protein